MEDDSDTREVLQAVLQSNLDRRVMTANDGQEALSTLKGGTFDVVITDYRMPNMNGLDLLEQLKWQPQPQIRVLMTAYYDDDLNQRAFDQGADACFNKPLDIQELLRFLRARWGAAVQA